MKKTIIALVATIMAGACVFFACSKEEDRTLKNEKCLNVSEKNFPFEKIHELAQNHNIFLDKIFDNLDISAEDLISEMDNAIERTHFGDISEEEMNYIFEYSFKEKENPSTTEDMICKINQSEYVEAKNTVIDFILCMQNIPIKEETSVFDVSIQVDQIISTASKKLTNINDLCVVAAYGEVYKESLRYWFPEEFGGIGRGYYILNAGNQTKSKPNSSRGKKIAGQAALADCEAAATGMVATAVAGVICPPATAAGLVCTGVGVALSSGWAAIKEAAKTRKKR